MADNLAGKRILLGVTGSIAAYKSAELVRRLQDSGASVRVVMTENAKRFITPLTMQAVSGYPVHDDLFDLQAEAAMGHIELARWADVIVIAPASANCIAQLVQGEASNLLTTICMASKAAIALAPAMNQGMWHHTNTQTHIQALMAKGITIIGPGKGIQACGDVGLGRMLEVEEIVVKLNALFANHLLAGINVLLTAGPTHEALDPIRYLTNISSGKMGYALAQAAREAGANVTLVSGPTHISQPKYINTIEVKTALQMQQAVMERIAQQDIFIAVAAVSDYRAQTIASQKIAKASVELTLTLVRNPDIVAEVAKLTTKPFIVGFAAETENLQQHAQQKLLKKNMDMIIANLVNEGLGMGVDDNQVMVISKSQQYELAKADKSQLARSIIPIIANEYHQTKRKRKIA